VEDALAYFATHLERVKAHFGLYLDHLATPSASPESVTGPVAAFAA
jgi:hypothetical protein